jgi:integrase
MSNNLNVKYTLFKKRGWYYVDFWLEGKRYKKTTKTRKKNEADDVARLIVKNKIKEIYEKSECMLSDLISQYIELIKIENKTWDDKIVRLKRFFKFVGDKNLSEITPAECQGFITNISKTKFTKATVNRYIATIKHLFNKAIEWELLDRNPMRNIKLFRETPRLRFYTASELERLIKAARELSEQKISQNQYLFFYIMMTAIYTGMRLGEIINLKWMDIRDDNFVIQNSKSGLKRIVPIKRELMDILKDLPTVNEYIFPLHRKEADVITKIWHKVRESACVKDGRFHDLRHTFGSNLIKSGVDIVTVKEILGHSDLKMTQIYTHSSISQKKAAIGNLSL